MTNFVSIPPFTDSFPAPASPSFFSISKHPGSKMSVPCSAFDVERAMAMEGASDPGYIRNSIQGPTLTWDPATSPPWRTSRDGQISSPASASTTAVVSPVTSFEGAASSPHASTRSRAGSFAECESYDPSVLYYLYVMDSIPARMRSSVVAHLSHKY